MTTIYSDHWDKRLKVYGRLDVNEERDLDDFVATYSKNAVLQVYDRESGKLKVCKGHAQIKEYFRHHFKCLTNDDGKKGAFYSDYMDHDIKHDGMKPDGNTLFFPWKATSDTTEFKDCAETLVFEPVDEGKSALISYHYQFIREIPLKK